MRLRLNRLSLLLTTALLAACNSTSEIDEKIRHYNIPAKWQNSAEQLTVEQFNVEHGWLNQIPNQQIKQLVDLALNNNFELKQQAFAVEVQQQELIVAGSALWPSLDLSLRAGRDKNSQENSTSRYNNNASLGLDLSYELDLWGKLSAADQQANLTLVAQQTSFEQAKQQLVADVVMAWFSVIEAKQLVKLYQQRTDNTQQNLDIIQLGYQRGLNSALDVYLTRNEVANEQSRTSAQKNALVVAIRELELLIGQYPQGLLEVDAKLPLLDSAIPQGLPSELVSRKPELVASWYQLLAQDAALAYAHKQRFPSLTLTASVGQNSEQLSDLLSASSLGWSLMGSLAMPLFNAGRLEANEEKARLQLKQQEQIYLDSLHNAFADVENRISEEQSLTERYQMMLTAQQNAMAAETLSFENYLAGLVDYTTVLDAQSRSFDAQSTLIEIKNQLIANRIKLHLALGGDFSAATQPSLAE
ncbi:TolC family protein [Thalassotalea sp. PLHSN55]|uniref:TolC family protein n=1 Tax=Thalassotalea sp. PLHSN55 TaxID=3435888 RepID=UPI003F834964